jgi:hypothetical protein
MAPATYSRASPASIIGRKITCRKSQAKKNIVNGLMSQFTTRVMVSPFGWRRTPRMLAKSICTIMGKIISQMRIATGTETCAYVKRASVSGTAGRSWPMATPATMQSATHTVRYRPKRPSSRAPALCSSGAPGTSASGLCGRCSGAVS